MFLFTGGLQYPVPAAISGAVWILGKVAYSNGYYTGGTSTRIFASAAGNFYTFSYGADPDKRKRGDFAYFGIMTLVGCSTMFAAKLLGWL